MVGACGLGYLNVWLFAVIDCCFCCLVILLMLLRCVVLLLFMVLLWIGSSLFGVLGVLVRCLWFKRWVLMIGYLRFLLVCVLVDVCYICGLFSVSLFVLFVNCLWFCFSLIVLWYCALFGLLRLPLTFVIFTLVSFSCLWYGAYMLTFIYKSSLMFDYWLLFT